MNRFIVIVSISALLSNTILMPLGNLYASSNNEQVSNLSFKVATVRDMPSVDYVADIARCEQVIAKLTKDFDSRPVVNEMLGTACFNSGREHNNHAEKLKLKEEIAAALPFYVKGIKRMSRALELKHPDAKEALKHICYNSAIVHYKYAGQEESSAPASAIDSFELAIEHMDQALQLGDPDAKEKLTILCINYAVMHYTYAQKKVRSDFNAALNSYNIAIQYLKKALNLGDRENASEMLKQVYFDLVDLTQSIIAEGEKVINSDCVSAMIYFDLATEYLTKAAEHGHKEKKSFLGLALYHSAIARHKYVSTKPKEGTEDSEVETNIAILGKARDLCQKAVELKNVKAAKALQHIELDYKIAIWEHVIAERTKNFNPEDSAANKALSNARFSCGMAYSNLGLTLKEGNNLKDAIISNKKSIEHLEQAHKLGHPGANKQLTFGCYNSGILNYDYAVELCKQNKFEDSIVPFEQAIEHFIEAKEREFPEADKPLGGAYINSAAALHNCAKALLNKEGKLKAMVSLQKKALDHCRKAVKLNPKDIQARAFLSTIESEYTKYVLADMPSKDPVADIAKCDRIIAEITKNSKPEDSAAEEALRSAYYTSAMVHSNYGLELSNGDSEASILYQKKGMELLVKAHNLGHLAAAGQLARACYNLGLEYHNYASKRFDKGEFDAAIASIEMSIKYFTKAKEQDYPKADTELGHAYSESALIRYIFARKANGKDRAALQKKALEHCEEGARLKSPAAFDLLPQLKQALSMGSNAAPSTSTASITKKEQVTKLHIEQSNKAYEALKTIITQLFAESPKNEVANSEYLERIKSRFHEKLSQVLRNPQPIMTGCYKNHSALYTKLFIEQLKGVTIKPVHSKAEIESEGAIFKGVIELWGDIVDDVRKKVKKETHLSEIIAKVISAPTAEKFLLMLEYFHGHIISDAELIRTSCERLQGMAKEMDEAKAALEERLKPKQALKVLAQPKTPVEPKTEEKPKSKAERRKEKAAEARELAKNIAAAVAAASLSKPDEASNVTTEAVPTPPATSEKKDASKEEQPPVQIEATTVESTAVKTEAEAAAVVQPRTRGDKGKGKEKKKAKQTLPDLQQAVTNKPNLDAIETSTPPALAAAGSLASKPEEKGVSEGQPSLAQTDGNTSAIATPVMPTIVSTTSPPNPVVDNDNADGNKKTYELPLKKKKKPKATNGKLPEGAQARVDLLTKVETSNMATAASATVLSDEPTAAPPQQPEVSTATAGNGLIGEEVDLSNLFAVSVGPPTQREVTNGLIGREVEVDLSKLFDVPVAPPTQREVSEPTRKTADSTPEALPVTNAKGKEKGKGRRKRREKGETSKLAGCQGILPVPPEVHANMIGKNAPTVDAPNALSSPAQDLVIYNPNADLEKIAEQNLIAEIMEAMDKELKTIGSPDIPTHEELVKRKKLCQWDIINRERPEAKQAYGIWRELSALVQYYDRKLKEIDDIIEGSGDVDPAEHRIYTSIETLILRELQQAREEQLQSYKLLRELRQNAKDGKKGHQETSNQIVFLPKIYLTRRESAHRQEVKLIKAAPVSATASADIANSQALAIYNPNADLANLIAERHRKAVIKEAMCVESQKKNFTTGVDNHKVLDSIKNELLSRINGESTELEIAEIEWHSRHVDVQYFKHKFFFVALDMIKGFRHVEGDHFSFMGELVRSGLQEAEEEELQAYKAYKVLSDLQEGSGLAQTPPANKAKKRKKESKSYY